MVADGGNSDVEVSGTGEGGDLSWVARPKDLRVAKQAILQWRSKDLWWRGVSLSHPRVALARKELRLEEADCFPATLHPLGSLGGLVSGS